MVKFYLIAAIIFMVIGAYLTGAHVARIKCRTEAANAQTTEIINISKMQRNTDDKVFHTGMRDIRRIMRTKYTIAD